MTPEPAAPPGSAFRPCLAYIDSAAAKDRAGQLRYRSVRFGAIGHLNECEAARLARFPVPHEIYPFDGPELLEKLPYGFFRDAEIQVPNKNPLQTVSLRLRPAWRG